MEILFGLNIVFFFTFNDSTNKMCTLYANSSLAEINAVASFFSLSLPQHANVNYLNQSLHFVFDAQLE